MQEYNEAEYEFGWNEAKHCCLGRSAMYARYVAAFPGFTNSEAKGFRDGACNVFGYNIFEATRKGETNK